jgi:hypothetical protein
MSSNISRGLWAAVAALVLTVPAQAVTVVFVAGLSGPAEFPPVPSPGTGFASVAFDDVAGSVTVHVDFGDLLAPTTAAHLHCCTAVPFTDAAPVMLGLTGFPTVVTAGIYDHVFTPPVFAALLTGAMDGKAYLNIHTTSFPGGEIRGFLMPVPEAGSAALMLLGLAGVGWGARRRA